MKIVIPIKQVPETSKVKIDEEKGTMVREGVTSIINPLDLYAIEAGIQLKEKYSGKITVCTMGPPSAEKCLKEAISMGCDDGILLSSKKFAGSDTWATSYVLAQTLKNIGEFDLVIAGERATDGDTGQVGPGLAAWLDLPLATYVSRIDEVYNKKITVERLIEEGYQVVELPLPALLTVVKEVSKPRLPTLRGKKLARKTKIPLWTENDFELDNNSIGLAGSPTKVTSITHPKVSRNGKIVNADDTESIDKATDELIELMKSQRLI